MPPWLWAWHKVKLTYTFQQIYILLTLEIVLFLFFQSYNNTSCILKVYHFMHVSYSFSEAELAKVVLLINFSNRLHKAGKLVFLYKLLKC